MARLDGVAASSSERKFAERREVEMVKMNFWKRMFPVRTHEGAVAQRVDVKSELRRTVMTCLLWEDTFYEKGNDIAKRIAELVAQSSPRMWRLLRAKHATRCSFVMHRSL
jgi:predicted nucleotide-binding protein